MTLWISQSMDAVKCNRAIGRAMDKYQAAKDRADTKEMRKRELIIVAAGGQLDQARFPSRWWFLFRMSKKAKAAWQAGRESAERKLYLEE